MSAHINVEKYYTISLYLLPEHSCKSVFLRLHSGHLEVGKALNNISNGLFNVYSNSCATLGSSFVNVFRFCSTEDFTSLLLRRELFVIANYLVLSCLVLYLSNFNRVLFLKLHVISFVLGFSRSIHRIFYQKLFWFRA